MLPMISKFNVHIEVFISAQHFYHEWFDEAESDNNVYE